MALDDNPSLTLMCSKRKSGPAAVAVMVKNRRKTKGIKRMVYYLWSLVYCMIIKTQFGWVVSGRSTGASQNRRTTVDYADLAIDVAKERLWYKYKNR